MATVDPDLLETIEVVFRRLARNYYAPMPAKVSTVSTDQLGRTRADVIPLANALRIDSDTLQPEGHIAAAVIEEVPVILVASSASDVGLKLQPGDVGLYIPCMFSLDQLIDSDVSTPVDLVDSRQQAYMDGLFLPFQWNRTLPTGANAADRAITGGDVRVGTPSSAESLAFQQSTQNALNTVLHPGTGWLKSYIDTVAAGGPAPTWAGAPTVGGTSNLKGS